MLDSGHCASLYRAYRGEMIDAVIFDLDETLFDRTTSLHAFLDDQFERFAERLGRASSDEWRNRFLVLDQGGHVHKTLVYPAILAEFGGEPSAEHELFADYVSRCPVFARPFDGAITTLRAIRALGLPIGIVTNGETEFQTNHIEALGLHRLVDTILISQREELRKPDAALFRRAADCLNVSPERCLFVGDNPVADILGAAATGMRTAWFLGSTNWPVDQPSNPGATIDRLEMILHLLKRDN